MKYIFRTLAPALAAILVLSLLAWPAGRWYHARLLAEAQAEVEHTLAPYAQSLANVVDQRAAILHGLVAFGHSHSQYNELHMGFNSFATGLVSAGLGVRAVQIFTPGKPVEVFPIAGNEATVGRTLEDLINDERIDVRTDVQRAIQTGRVTISGPYELRQGGLGMVIRQAVFEDNLLWGIAVVVIDLPPLLDEANLTGEKPHVVMALRDADGVLLSGEASVFEQQPVTANVDLPEGHWELAGIPPGGWQAQVDPGMRGFTYPAVAVILLAAGLVYVVSHSQRQLHNQVDQRTAQLGNELVKNQQTLEALRTSENKFRSLAETARDIILIHDMQGEILYMNQAGLQTCGLTESDIAAGVNLTRFVPLPYHSMLAQHAAERRQKLNKSRLYEMEIIDHTGHLLPIEVSSSPLYQNGEISGVVVLARDMTERRKAQQELLVALAKYRTLFEAFPQGVIMASNQGQILETNRAAQHMLGFQEVAELRHNTSTGVWKLWHPDGTQVKPSQLASAQVLSTHQPVENEEMGVQRPDGSVIWISINATPLDVEGYGAVVTFSDISRRFQAEQARAKAEKVLRENEERFRLLYEQAPLVYQSLDERGCINEVNLAWLEVLQYQPVEVAGRWFGDFIIPEQRERFRQRFAELLSSGKLDDEEFQLQRKDGSRLVGSLDGRVGRSLDEQFQRVHCVLHDVTGRKQIEERIRQLNSELEQRVAERTAELLNSNRELEAFAYSVSHDLRTPLRAIDGFSRILQEDYAGRLDAEADRLLQVIRDSTLRMDQLITDLLALSRVSSTELAYTHVAMGQMAQDVFRELTTPELRQQIEFHLVDLPDCEGDPILLHQVWSNLLSNAIKYTQRQPARSIEVGYAHHSGLDAYYVKDNGTGFNPKYYNKLFGLFQRLHKTDEFEGNGVGLAIVRRILQRHRGQVWAISQPGQGATFFFSLPQPDAPTPPPVIAA